MDRLISEEALTDVVNYLGRQPYNETFKIINHLMNLPPAPMPMLEDAPRVEKDILKAK